LGEMHLFRGRLHSCIWDLFFSWFLVVLFCRWCRALLPPLAKSAIWEHFISVTSSCCRCLRGPRFFSLKLSFIDFCLAFDHLFEFFVNLFSFSLFLELVTCVCRQCTHHGGDWEPERLRTGGWSLLVVMSDWQRGVDWLLAEYCRCRLRLDLHWCRWRASMKGLCLAGPPRSGETSRLGLRDLVASGIKCGPLVARKARRSRGQEPVQGSGSRAESACGVCGDSPQNCRVTWLSHKTKTRGSAGGDGFRARREALMSADIWRDRRACVGRTRTATTVWSCDEEECYMTYMPLSGLYHNLSARGSLVFCPNQRDSYILNLGFCNNLKFHHQNKVATWCSSFIFLKN
jgi:hypothetical protein